MLLSDRKLAEDTAGRILPEGHDLSGDRMRKTEFIRCKRDVGTMRTRAAGRYAVSTGLCGAPAAGQGTSAAKTACRRICIVSSDGSCRLVSLTKCRIVAVISPERQPVAGHLHPDLVMAAGQKLNLCKGQFPIWLHRL